MAMCFCSRAKDSSNPEVFYMNQKTSFNNALCVIRLGPVISNVLLIKLHFNFGNFLVL